MHSFAHSIATLSLITIIFTLLSFTIPTQAFNSHKNQHNSDHIIRHARRGTYNISAPSDFKISWQVDGNRTTLGKKNGLISYYTVATEGSIQQSSIDNCTAQCDITTGCQFINLFEMSNSTKGTVLCGMFQNYVSSTQATQHTGPGRGTVVTSYGARRLPKSSIVEGFPKSPKGATLVQFQPCPTVNATVPLFVNSQFNSSTATRLYIVQHGADNDFQTYFRSLFPLVGLSSILVAPSFYGTDNKPAPKTWYQPSINLAWAAGTGSWAAGADAVAPESGVLDLDGGQCSSFDVYDALLNYFSDSTKFPNLKTVFMVGHSGGANTVSRYSQFYNDAYPFSMRFILANAANQAYFTDTRAEMDVCDAARIYPYQLETTGMNRYVKSRFVSSMATYQTWLTRDIVTLVGDWDTADRFPGGTQNCQSQAQGGRNRRDRNYAWWAYVNILAGSTNNVTDYYGYDDLIANGASQIDLASPLNHQICVIGGVGHDADLMFGSDCGRAALAKRALPPGVGPDQP